MFKPKFRYTHKIVRLLARISAAREVILNSPLIPKWEVALRREAIIHSAHSSTSIEGNRLSFEQVSDLAQGREVMATIHPFVDGNGRTARVLATWILYKRGFDTKQFFCLDDYYDSDRQAYYKALTKRLLI